MLDGDCLVVVEVRFRNNRSFVAAGHTIDRRKQQKIIRATALFLAWNDCFANQPVRFDVVGVDADAQWRAVNQLDQGRISSHRFELVGGPSGPNFSRLKPLLQACYYLTTRRCGRCRGVSASAVVCTACSVEVSVSCEKIMPCPVSRA